MIQRDRRTLPGKRAIRFVKFLPNRPFDWQFLDAR